MHSGRRRGSKGRNACRLPAQPRGPGRREHVEILRAGVDLPSGGAHWFLCPFPSPFTIKEKNRPLPASCQGSPPLTPPGGACVIEARGLCSQQLMVPPEAINQAGTGGGGGGGDAVRSPLRPGTGVPLTPQMPALGILASWALVSMSHLDSCFWPRPSQGAGWSPAGPGNAQFLA